MCCIVVVLAAVAAFESVFNVPEINGLLEQGAMIIVLFIILLCICGVGTSN